MMKRFKMSKFILIFLVGIFLPKICFAADLLDSSFNEIEEIEAIQEGNTPSAYGVESYFEHRAFRMIIPEGWEITNRDKKDEPLEIISPKVEGEIYQGNIKIMRFNDTIRINEQTAKKYEEKIRNRHNFLSYIKEFSIRNYDEAELADGNKAILIYSEFKIDQSKLMQAHILIPAAKTHYLVTYTDIQEKFEGSQKEVFLDKVWNSLISFKPSNPVPTNSGQLKFWLTWALMISLVFGVFFFIRYYMQKRDERLDPLEDSEFADDESFISSRHELDSIIKERIDNYGKTKRKTPLFTFKKKKLPVDEFESIHSTYNVQDENELAEEDLIQEDDDELIAI